MPAAKETTITKMEAVRRAVDALGEGFDRPRMAVWIKRNLGIVITPNSLSAFITHVRNERERKARDAAASTAACAAAEAIAATSNGNGNGNGHHANGTNGHAPNGSIPKAHLHMIRDLVRAHGADEVRELVDLFS